MEAFKLDAMDIEAMRKEDSSWHPCCISLSSSNPNVGIVVHFGIGDEEDVIYDKEDALSHLRFRSTPLQGVECSNVKEGDRVLALQKTQSKSLFIDAIIKEPKRVKHSERVHCRCAFEVKWLNSDLKGETVVVPSKSILKNSDRSIAEHPVFSSFLKALSSENGRKSPIPSFSEESSCEAEFVGILEKQVEEISKLVDGSISSLNDLFLEVKSANAVKQKLSPVLMQSKSSKNRPVSAKRITRSKNNKQIETEATEETELKPVLSPLAARAALASLVHELPEKSSHFPGEDFIKPKDSQQSDATGITELSATDATSNSVKSTFGLQSLVLLSSNPSKSTNDCTRLEVGNPLISSPNRQKTNGKMKFNGSSNRSATQEKEMEVSRDYKPIIHHNSRNSQSGEKTKISSSTRRLTRSMQKEPVLTNPARSANKEVITSTVVIDKAPISRSPSFELIEEFASDEDDVEEVLLLKKSADSTNGSECTKSAKRRKKGSSTSGFSPDAGNKAEELITPDKYEIKKKLISCHVDSTAETGSTVKGNEPATKRRTRLPNEDYRGANIKEEETHQVMKKNHASLKKSLAAPPLRSSPRFACSPKTRSQAKS